MWKLIFFMMSFILIMTCSNTDQETIPVETGNYVQVSLSSDSLDTSLDYYRKLGFQEIEIHKSTPVPWALISDGFQIYMISQNNFPSPSLTYFGSNLDEDLPGLESTGLKPQRTVDEAGRLQSAVLVDPNGLGISLINMGSQGLPRPDISDSTITGIFREISIPTPNLTESLVFWKNLGFIVTSEAVEPYPVAILSDNKIHIGLHQTTLFTSPALTYHSSNIEKVREYLTTLDLPFEPFAENLNGIRMRSPDGQLIFIFPIFGD